MSTFDNSRFFCFVNLTVNLPTSKPKGLSKGLVKDQEFFSSASGTAIL